MYTARDTYVFDVSVQVYWMWGLICLGANFTPHCCCSSSLSVNLYHICIHAGHSAVAVPATADPLLRLIFAGSFWWEL